MSADNWNMVRKHPNGGYAIVMGFASDTDEDGNEYIPEVPTNAIQYATLTAALTVALDEYTEYGTSIHPECEE